MAKSHTTGLYGGGFEGWLEKRNARLPGHPYPHFAESAKSYARVDVTALLRAEFDPADLARLNAMGLAT